MDEIKKLIENLQKANTIDPIGYSIYGYDNNKNRIYDIYLPTNGLDNFYFMTYANGILYDIHSNVIELSNYKNSLASTQEIIEANFRKLLTYIEFSINEHNRLNYSDYQNPTENEANDYLNLGFEAFEIEDYDEAFDNYSKAIYEKPYDPALYMARARVFDKRKQTALAIDDICRGGIANPISNQNIFTFAFESLGATYSENKNFEAAIKCYTIAIENNGGQPWNVQSRAKCFSQLGLHDKAINDLRKLISDKKSIFLYFDLGEALLKASLIKEAKDAFNNVVNFLPDTEDEMYRKMLDDINKPTKDKAIIHLQKLNQ